MALLLTGTLKGLLSYSTTMKGMESKTGELIEADKLRAAVNDLGTPANARANLAEALSIMNTRMGLALEAKAAYEVALTDTLRRRRDPENGFVEKQLISSLNERFEEL